MTVVVLLESAVLLVLCVLVAGLLRAHGAVLRRLHDLDGGDSGAPRGREFALAPAGSPPASAVAGAAEAPFGPAFDIAGESLAGEIVSIRVVDVEHDTLLLFLSSGCSSCATFWDELAQPAGLPQGVRLLAVPQSAADESLADLLDVAPPNADVVLSSQAWRDYGVPGSPHAVFVDGRVGRVRGEGTGQSLGQVVALLARFTGENTGGADLRKSRRDASQEAAVDRELLAAGIVPGDRRLYQIEGPEPA